MMRPDKSNVIGDQGIHTAGYSAQAPRSAQPGREFRPDERLRRLLSQKRGPDAVMLSALSVALLCGLIGFAVNFMWVVAVIVMALALGFVIADSRRNRIDIANQRGEGKDG
ncbi:hypothetical protein KGQ20_12720 [Catenulispora sp. NF23]|nr:hypothetical protein [Catenulispora pinistramenti]